MAVASNATRIGFSPLTALTLPFPLFSSIKLPPNPKNLHHQLVGNTPSIVALIATRFRSTLLSRLLSSLASQTLRPLAAVITDNGPDPATALAAQHSPIPAKLLSPGKNLGFGGGLAFAGQAAFTEFPSLTHLLVIDDDAILSPSDLATLISSMEKHSVGSIAPFLVDAAGQLQEVPEPASWTLARSFRAVGQNLTAARALSPSGYLMAWCIGPCLLIDRSTWLRAGPPRSDMIAYGDDIEFSLRLSAASPAWAEPSVAVTHAPPEPPATPASKDSSAHYKKFGMLLQNLAFTCVTSPRPRHLPLYLPGNARRFLKTFGPSPTHLGEVIRRYTLGLLGIPPRP
jgi:GT2 family glycosyltransferase